MYEFLSETDLIAGICLTLCLSGATLVFMIFLGKLIVMMFV